MKDTFIKQWVAMALRNKVHTMHAAYIPGNLSPSI